MMHPRADAADPVDDTRNFLSRTSLDKFFEPAQRLDMKECILHIAGIIEMYGNFGMSFNAGNRRNIYYSSHF
jgi:hypothetical protein